MRYAVLTINKPELKEVLDGTKDHIIRNLRIDDVPTKTFIYTPPEDGGERKVVGEFVINSYWVLGNRKFAWGISDLCKYKYPKLLSDFEIKKPPIVIQYVPKAVIKRNNL